MAASTNIKLEKSANLLRETIPKMSQLKIPLTPENYHTWYEYSLGRHKDLTQEINNLINSGTKFTSKINSDLYNTHIHIPPGEELHSFQEDVQNLVGSLLSKISSLTQNTQNFSGTLEKYSTELSDNPDISTVANLVSNLIEDTESVIQANKSMEDTLTSMSQEVNTLKNDIAALNTEATTDQLTAVPNRRAFDQRLDELFDELYEDGQIFSLLLIDIDHFKQFNDTHGHAVGDKVLKYVASSMQGSVKGDDLLARYGGEEFAALLPLTKLEDAKTVAENIRTKVASNKLVDNKNDKSLGNIHVSIGVAFADKKDDAESLIIRADKALYRAKETGRNKVLGEDDIADN